MSRSTSPNYATAKSADALGIIVGGQHSGSVRRIEPGDLPIGGAVAVEEPFVLVRLSLTHADVIGGSGL